MPVIGKGTYGCVIRPPLNLTDGLLYKKYEDVNDMDVAKLFTQSEDPDEDFEKELKELENIEKIDAKHSFTVPYKGAGYGKLNYELNEPSIYDCIRVDENERIYQIILGYGGADINKTRCKITYIDFLQIFEKFVKGIKLLGRKGVVHQDIKPANVLFDCGNKKLNLIDFGLSTSINEAYKIDNEYFTSFYLYHPPDYFIVSQIFKHSENLSTLLDVLYELMNSCEENYSGQLKTRDVYTVQYLKYMANSEIMTNNFFNTLKDFIATVIYKIETEYKDSGTASNEIKRKKLINFLYNKVLTKDIALKIDVYPLSFIIIELRKHIKDDAINIDFMNLILTDCSTSNPYDRISAPKLLEKILDEKKRCLQLNRSNKRVHASMSRSPSMSPSNSPSKTPSGGHSRSNKMTSLIKTEKVILNIDTDIKNNIKYDKIKLMDGKKIVKSFIKSLSKVPNRK